MDKPELTARLKLIFEAELASEMAQVGEIRTVREGEALIDYGQQIRFFPLILNGTVKVMRRNEEGNEIILYYIGSNESCAMAYSCCMESRKSEIRAIAEEDVLLLAIPHSKLDEWVQRFRSWRSYVFGSFNMRLNEMVRSLEMMAFSRLDERLVKYLKEKSRISGKNTLSLSHQHIAAEMGTSRVVISRLLKQLENEKKLLLYRNEIKLLSGF